MSVQRGYGNAITADDWHFPLCQPHGTAIKG
jgi:hypothetical protein